MRTAGAGVLAVFFGTMLVGVLAAFGVLHLSGWGYPLYYGTLLVSMLALAWLDDKVPPAPPRPRRPTRWDKARQLVEDRRELVEARQSEWRAVLLGTDPADRPATEEAITELYRLEGLARPRFVWTGSPVTGSLTVGLLSGGVILEPSRSLRAALADPRWDVIGPPLRDSVVAALVAAYGDDLGFDEPLRNHLSSGQRARLPWWELLDRSVQRSTGLPTRDLHEAHIGTPWYLTTFEGHLPGDWMRVVNGGTVWEFLAPVPCLPGWLQAAVNGEPGIDPAIAATHDLWRRIGLVRYDDAASAALDLLLTVARSCAWWWGYPKVCVLSERPTRLVLERADGMRRPHNPDGPAIEYRDGLTRWAWHGVLVPERVITGELTGEDWLREENVEIRRAIAERMGYAWLLDRCAATKVADDEYGTLWRLRDPVDEPMLLLDVVNSTPEPDGSFRRYVLRVPPDQTRPRDAIGWTFGLPPGAYRPTTMT